VLQPDDTVMATKQDRLTRSNRDLANIRHDLQEPTAIRSAKLLIGTVRAK
jgi:DNA invertase Pin-like site-specific DNA recombinase